jgi:hypothetical protein
LFFVYEKKGKEPGFSDYMIWPWFERIQKLKTLIDAELDPKRLPKIVNWRRKMLMEKAVIANKSEKDQMVDFYKVSLTNKEPNYDIGLPEPEPSPQQETEEAKAQETKEE